MFQYENDDTAIARAVALAQQASEEIGHGTARAIASQYNELGPVASFVSTGAITTEDGSTLWRLVTDGGVLYQSGSASERMALDSLGTYFLDRVRSGDTDRITGWSDMWVPKHVDYPHQDGALDTCWCFEDDEDA